MALLQVEDLHTHFATPDGLVRAVDGVSMSVERGAFVGIVGESGSGKSVLNLTILGLVPSPPAIVRASKIEFEGQDLQHMSDEARRKLRGNRVAMVFQDPMTSLNPFLTIGEQLAEPLVVHRGWSQKKARGRVIEMLEEVGIPAASRRVDEYPHEFSGGMRQRAMMAMALVCEPALLIADEPTTALDVTIQAQILELLERIRREHGTTIILITHDLGVAAGFCDEIYVMYAGRVVEHAETRTMFAKPAHPYTRALLRSVPRLDEESRARFVSIRGTPPDLTALPPGCSFEPRCDYATEHCRTAPPPLEPPEGETARQKACYFEPPELDARDAERAATSGGAS